ncbi:lytic transglycosylase domain-containing protein [Moraxella sp. ZJ142]|uniref:lytic transglycosylase domain-containing protein n=1 Tax=Moraxella marmotae TaxID=3344520 RepID=UPI0035D502EE
MKSFKTQLQALSMAAFGMVGSAVSTGAFAQTPTTPVTVYIEPKASANTTVSSNYTLANANNATEQTLLTSLQTNTAGSQKFTQISSGQPQVVRLYTTNQPTANYSATLTSSTANSYANDYSERSAYDHLIREAAARHGVDPALIKAIIHTESTFNPYARSPVGAMGLMQLMPGTARDMGVYNAWDPAQNIEGGTKYIAFLQRQFSNPDYVIAAYNAGPGNVRKHGGIPPFRETRNYVKRVNDRYNNIYRMDAALYQGYDANRTMLAMNDAMQSPAGGTTISTKSYAQPINQATPANPVIGREATSQIYFLNNQ